MSTRTGPQVKKLVEAIQEDLGEAREVLAKGREILGALEPDVRGVNGLSSSVRAWGQQVDKLLSDLEEEAEAVAKKMLGGGPKITQHVDTEHAKRVEEAR